MQVKKLEGPLTSNIRIRITAATLLLGPELIEDTGVPFDPGVQLDSTISVTGPYYAQIAGKNRELLQILMPDSSLICCMRQHQMDTLKVTLAASRVS